jgi:hypothetical protein
VICFTSLIALSLLVTYLFFGHNLDFFNPGKLSPSHGFIDNCQDCHQLTPQTQDQNNVHSNTQGKLCTQCHNKITHIEHPHNDQSLHTTANSDCKHCHDEHQGSDGSLSTISPDSCNSCHEQTILSFSTNHPPFEDLAAANLNTRAIHFNHSEHADSYFPQKDQDAFTCINCHISKDDGRSIGIKPFKESCSECHQSDVDGSISDAGIPVWSTPALDLDNINASIPWPESAIDDEAEMSLIQLWLIENRYPNLKLGMLATGEIDLSSLEDLSAAQHKLVLDYLQAAPMFMKELLDRDSNASVTLPSFLQGILFTEHTLLAYENFYLSSENEVDYEDAAPGNTAVSQSSFQYKPSGHQDILLNGLINALAAKENKTTVERELFKMLLDDNTAGQCGQCHLKVKGSDLNTPFNPAWYDNSTIASQKRLSLFSHKPHMTTGSKLSCKQCHRLGDTSEFDLVAIELNNCQQCHNNNQVSSDCAQCHRYHIHAPDDSM